MKLEITSCSRRSILTSFRTTFTLELFKVLCCCCLKVFPFIAHSIMFGQKTTTTKKRRKIPFSPRKKKESEFRHPPFSATHINRKWAFFSFNKPWRHYICIANSLRGRRSKGTGEGIRARDHARGRREEGGGDPFSLASPTRSPPPKFPLPPCLNSYRRLAQKIVQNYGSRVQKAHVRLTCVAQKHRCWNCLTLTSCP